MSRRNNLDRCVTCRMHETLCICALVPRLETRTRLALLLHYREVPRPTNTGQLAARCLPRSTIEVIGDQERRAELPKFEAHEQPLLLYPAADAVSIEEYANSDRPVVLIVPDGSWRQAHKMRKRIPGLSAVPCVILPEAGRTEYRLRAEHHAGGLATFEAIARALRILEGDAGPATESALMNVFRIMVERTLWLRGTIPDREVTDGVPQAAIDHNPRNRPATRGSRPPSR
ncbi:MAG: DTW domain-containing protein [Deltaproteobacteria bacterium]|nr:DTW domain-containing protein [Deltaproteobacteria bacterium]